MAKKKSLYTVPSRPLWVSGFINLSAAACACEGVEVSPGSSFSDSCWSHEAGSDSARVSISRDTLSQLVLRYNLRPDDLSQVTIERMLEELDINQSLVLNYPPYEFDCEYSDTAGQSYVVGPPEYCNAILANIFQRIAFLMDDLRTAEIAEIGVQSSVFTEFFLATVGFDAISERDLVVALERVAAGNVALNVYEQERLNQLIAEIGNLAPKEIPEIATQLVTVNDDRAVVVTVGPDSTSYPLPASIQYFPISTSEETSIAYSDSPLALSQFGILESGAIYLQATDSPYDVARLFEIRLEVGASYYNFTDEGMLIPVAQDDPLAIRNEVIQFLFQQRQFGTKPFEIAPWIGSE